MRIISGTAAARTLKVPKGYGVRPMPDLVRQALFNSLGARVEGARVLELFAGTAALSLECLSRGAAGAFCVEKARSHAQIIRQNLRTSGLRASDFSLRVGDAYAVLARLREEGQCFHLIMADPPFGEKNAGTRSTSHAQRLLDNEHLPPLLDQGGIFVLGHARRDRLTVPETWVEIKLLQHGDSVLRFFERRHD